MHSYLYSSEYGAGSVARELAPASARMDDRSLTVSPPSGCGGLIACEGGLTADLDAGSDRVHMRYLGKSFYWVRPYGGSLWKSRNAGPAQSKQRALAPTLGTSPRLGVPVIRQVFGGPPPRAIHGAGRLNRHPCRFTPQIPVEFRPACLTGRLRSKATSRSRATRFASWLPWLLWLPQCCVDASTHRRQAGAYRARLRLEGTGHSQRQYATGDDHRCQQV